MQRAYKVAAKSLGLYVADRAAAAAAVAAKPARWQSVLCCRSILPATVVERSPGDAVKISQQLLT